MQGDLTALVITFSEAPNIRRTLEQLALGEKTPTRRQREHG